MNNFLLYLGFFLVVVFAALFGVPYTIDWNSYRGVFEEEVSRVLGREVRVAGNVGLKLLPSPYLQFEKIRVGTAPGEKLSGTSFKAEDFRMWISVPPLLKGVLEANKIEVSRPVVETVLSNEERLPVSPTKQVSAQVSSFFKNITLQSVKLTDGSLRVLTSNGKELLQLEQVNGEFSAEALDGPFRFDGQFVYGETSRQIRVNTSELDAKGDLRFKLLVATPTSGNTYTVDAIAKDILGVLDVEGDFKARIKGSTLISDPLSRHETANLHPSKDQSLSFEVTSPIKIGRNQLILEDMTLNVEDSTLPQFIKGRSLLTWKDRAALEVVLSSKWLNLDPLLIKTPQETPPTPIELIPGFTKGFLKGLPQETDFKFEVSIDQLDFNKQKASALHVALEKAGGAIEIKEAKAEFPGASQFNLKGQMTSGNESSEVFFGDVSLEGQSLAQFSDWILGNITASSNKYPKDQHYAFSGDLKVGLDFIEFTKFKAVNKGIPVAGNINIVWRERPHVSASLNAEMLDLDVLGAGTLSEFLSAASGSEDVSRSITMNDSKGSSLEHFKNHTWTQNLDWDLDFEANTLVSTGVKVEDVSIAAFSRNRKLSLSKINLRSSDGLVIKLKSPSSEVTASSQRKLLGTLEAASSEGANKVVMLLGLSKETQDKLKSFTRLTPWALDCDISLGEGASPLFEVNLKGKVDGGQADIFAHLENPWADWRTSQMAWKVNIASTSLDSFFKNAGEKENSPPFTSADSQRGTLQLEATGKPSEGLETYLHLKNERDDLEFKGKTTVSSANIILGKGSISVESKNLSSFFLYTGFPELRNFDNVPIKGSFALDKDDGKITLETDDLILGTSSVSGTVSLGSDLSQRPLGVNARVAVDHLSVPAFLQVLSPQSSQVSPSVQQRLSEELIGSAETFSRDSASQNNLGKKNIWPNAPFDLNLLKVLNGSVDLKVASLNFDTGVAIKNARTELVLSSEGIDIKELQGEALGGKVITNFLIERQRAGVLGKGNVSLTLHQQNSKSEGDSKDKTSVIAILQAKFEGKGLTPRNLIDTFEGAGSLNIDRLNIQGGSPKAITDASKAYLQDKLSSSPKALADVIKSELQKNKLEIKKVTVPVEFHQGNFKIGKIESISDFGRTSIETDLNLQTLDLKSTFNIFGYMPFVEKGSKKLSKQDRNTSNSVSGTGEGKKELLPSVTVLFSGRLGDLENLNPTISLEGLQRELVVRRLELDANELEALRKQDEITSQDTLAPVHKEDLSNETSKDPMGGTTGQTPLPVTKEETPSPKINADITSSTQANQPAAETDNLKPNQKDTGDPSSIDKSVTSEGLPSNMNEGQNSSVPKTTKKKQSDSIWPSFNFWPF